MLPKTSKFIVIALCALLSQRFICPSNAQNPVFPGMDNGVYKSWLTTASYAKSSFLPSTSDTSVGGVQIHWTVDDEMIHLAVVAQATGWVAFGLAESGSMRGADIVLYTAEADTLVDSYVLDQTVKPFADDCQSWKLVNSVVDSGILIFEAQRLLNTMDTQDRIIINDSQILIPPTRVIAAWGNTSEPAYHGKSTARSSIRFFGTSDTADERELFAQSMAKEAEGNFTLSAQDFIIPSDVVTTYQRFCFSREDLLAMGVPIDVDLHTIGVEPLVAPGSKKYVHHFILFASPLPWNNTIECSSDTFPGIENAYTWAPGDLPLNLPSNVGGPLGSNGFQSFSLQIHYNNADLDANVSDSSGVRAYYTSIKREFDLGILQTADPFVLLQSGYVSTDGGYAQHSFGCGTECLGTYLNEPVNVIVEHLHMHMTGVSMVNYQIRDDQVIRESRVDFWDFAQQGDLAVVQAPFQIYPGDSFRTVCNYNAANTVQWGLGSQEEMCIAFLYYYPRVLVNDSLPLMCGLGVGYYLPGCNATYSVTPDFNSEAQLDRTFGGEPAMCPNTGGSGPIAPVSTPTKQDPTSSAVPTNVNSVALSVSGIIFWNVVHSFW
jgi:dopamine beta-monooxygenase